MVEGGYNRRMADRIRCLMRELIMASEKPMGRWVTGRAGKVHDVVNAGTMPDVPALSCSQDEQSR